MSPTVAQAWYDLTHAFGEPQISGQIRSKPQDFQVAEELSFDPKGQGDHTLVQIQKTDANTHWVAEQLARFCGVARKDVGFAGLKDRHAVTTQWLSVPVKGSEPDWKGFSPQGVRVLNWVKHNKKLRRGALDRNRFKLRIRDLRGDPDELKVRVTHVAQEGVPNYFGLQRFGNEGSNLQGAWSWFSDETRPRSRAARGFQLSAARAFLFNQVLVSRVMNHSWNTLLPGDRAILTGSNSHFLVPDLDDVLRARVADFDISPSGPLWGSGDLPSTAEINDLEQGVAEAFPLFARGLASQGLKQERRSLRVRPEDFKITSCESDVLIEFALMPGMFATAVLRELLQIRS